MLYRMRDMRDVGYIQGNRDDQQAPWALLARTSLEELLGLYDLLPPVYPGGMQMVGWLPIRYRDPQGRLVTKYKLALLPW